MSVILVAEDERDFQELLGGFLAASGHEVDRAENGVKAVSMIQSRKYDIVLVDLKLPGKDGMEVLQEIKIVSPDTEVILMTAFGNMDTATLAIDLGASDYLQKPFGIPELEMRVSKALKHRSLAREVAYLRHTQDVIYRVEDIVGKGDVIRGVLRQVEALAGHSAPVLIRGETGTGRGLIAGAIHFNGDRSEYGFVRVSSAIRNPDHLESDLFGHVKGAYPGADAARIGRIEQANGGTIFIEEIAETPPELQEKILNFIKTGRFKRFGGAREVSVDVRIIASTGRDLDNEVVSGRFLPELAAVLGEHMVIVPPLRERKEDIELLARFFLDRLRIELDSGRSAVISEKSMEKLHEYDWPGNIRELKNVLERALFASGKDLLEPSDIQLPDEEPDAVQAGLTDRKLKELEKEAVVEALEKTNYVQKDAAKLLGISKRVIHYKIQQFGIRHPRWIKNR